MSKIYYIMGKSSAGKDTIYKELLKNGSIKFNTVVGYTTRPMREGELHGREYYFVTEEEMGNMEEQGIIIEKRTYDTIYGKWNYFTAYDEQFKKEEGNLLIIGTLESYKKIREFFGEGKVVPIYIYVEDGQRLLRALNREMQQKEPKYAEMCRRFLADEKDFSKDIIEKLGIEKQFENKDEKKCLNEIIEYIKRTMKM